MSIPSTAQSASSATTPSAVAELGDTGWNRLFMLGLLLLPLQMIQIGIVQTSQLWAVLALGLLILRVQIRARVEQPLSETCATRIPKPCYGRAVSGAVFAGAIFVSCSGFHARRSWITFCGSQRALLVVRAVCSLIGSRRTGRIT